MGNTAFETIVHVNVPPWTETTGGDLDIDEYGLDVLQRKYDVRPDSIIPFLRAFPKGKEDVTFSYLYSMGPKITNVRGPMATATVLFKGALVSLSNVPPNPADARKESIKGGRQRQQVALTNISNLDQQKSVTYEATWTEWRYITITFPGDLGPAHRGEIVAKDKTVKVINKFGPFGDIVINQVIVPPGNRPPEPTLDGFNGFLKVNNSKFDYEQVGRVWTVLERNEILLVDYATIIINGDW